MTHIARRSCQCILSSQGRRHCKAMIPAIICNLVSVNRDCRACSRFCQSCWTAAKTIAGVAQCDLLTCKQADNMSTSWRIARCADRETKAGQGLLVITSSQSYLTGLWPCMQGFLCAPLVWMDGGKVFFMHSLASETKRLAGRTGASTAGSFVELTCQNT